VEVAVGVVPWATRTACLLLYPARLHSWKTGSLCLACGVTMYAVGAFMVCSFRRSFFEFPSMSASARSLRRKGGRGRRAGPGAAVVLGRDRAIDRALRSDRSASTASTIRRISVQTSGADGGSADELTVVKWLAQCEGRSGTRRLNTNTRASAQRHLVAPTHYSDTCARVERKCRRTTVGSQALRAV
jgi:hypothetical protein